VTFSLALPKLESVWHKQGNCTIHTLLLTEIAPTLTKNITCYPLIFALQTVHSANLRKKAKHYEQQGATPALLLPGQEQASNSTAPALACFFSQAIFSG
jgi:hypothetical protein